MIIANFGDGSDPKIIYDLYQWDYGQVLRIQGLTLPPAVEIHFSYSAAGGESVTRIGTTKDGATDATIPDSMLENEGTGKDYNIYVFIYLTDQTSGKTVKRAVIKVRSRPKPEAWESPEDEELFREVIQAVYESSQKAEEAAKQAEGWAHGREDLPDREKDNAAYYASVAKDAAAGIPGQVEDAKKEIDQYVSGKETELKGDTGNVYFAAFKVVDGRLKMYSDPEIDKVRFVRIGSRLAYRLKF